MSDTLANFQKKPTRSRRRFFSFSRICFNKYKSYNINSKFYNGTPKCCGNFEKPTNKQTVMRKTEIYLRSAFFASLLSVFCVLSCKQNNKTDDSEEVATEQNDQKFDNNDNKEDDSEILVDAAETSLLEIEVGKLAQSKGTSAHVKEMGKMLEADHSKALSDLQAFAGKKSVSIPTVITHDGKEHYADLNGKEAGKDFDRKFADMMVDGHQDAIDKMEDASKNANDADVRTWAAGMIPTLQMHLDHAKKLQDELK